MAHIHRIGFVLLLLLASWFPQSAYASFPATETAGTCTVGCLEYRAGNGGSSWSAWFPTLFEAATAYCTSQSGTYYEYTYTGVFNATNLTVQCASRDRATNAVTYPNKVYQARARASDPSTYSCPANSTLTGTSCSCDAPTFESGLSPNTCIIAVPPPSTNVCAAGPSGQYTAPYLAAEGIGSAKFTNLCDAGCVVKVEYEMAVGDTRYGTGTKTGGNCTAVPTSDGSGVGASPEPSGETPTPMGEPGISPCQKGEFMGIINGVQSCVKSLGGDVVLPPKEVTGDTQIKDAPTGATSSTTNTTCTGAGSCTTTTSFTNANGDPLGTTSETETRDGYCTKNPTSVACGGSEKQGSFAGSCGAAPACTGDPVMCAVAAATFATNCTLNPAESSESQLYDSAKGKGLVKDDILGEIPDTVISASSFNQTELLGAAVGLQDFQITVLGHTTTIVMSQLNIWFERLGFLLQAVALLGAARIVSRG